MRGLFHPVLYKSLNLTAYVSHHAELDLIFVVFAPFFRSRMQPTITQCDLYSFYCRSDQIFYAGHCILCLSTVSQRDAALLQLWSHQQIVWRTCTDWITWHFWQCWDCVSHDQHCAAAQCHLQIYRKAQRKILEIDFDVKKKGEKRLYRRTSKVKVTDTGTHVKCFCWPYYGLVVSWLGSCEWATKAGLSRRGAMWSKYG